MVLKTIFHQYSNNQLPYLPALIEPFLQGRYMNKQEQIIAAIREQKILPQFFHAEEHICLEVLQVLYRAGIRAVEFTGRGENDLPAFRAMHALCREKMQDMFLGAGHIRTSEMAQAFMEAGADFLISPVFDTGVSDVAYLNKILWIPGCMTPADIHIAEKAGCQVIKLFPAQVLGPGFVTSIHDIFPDLSFIPTGGLATETADLKAWFSAGVMALGIGNELITKKLMEEKDLHQLFINTKNLLGMAMEYHR